MHAKSRGLCASAFPWVPVVTDAGKACGGSLIKPAAPPAVASHILLLAGHAPCSRRPPSPTPPPFPNAPECHSSLPCPPNPIQTPPTTPPHPTTWHEAPPTPTHPRPPQCHQPRRASLEPQLPASRCTRRSRMMTRPQEGLGQCIFSLACRSSARRLCVGPMVVSGGGVQQA